MPITVKTFATLGEAATALAADRGARFLAGGTLVMRAVNEGDDPSPPSCGRPIAASPRSDKPGRASRLVPA